MDGRRWFFSMWSAAMLSGLVCSAANAEQRSPRTNYILHCAGCHGMDGAGSSKGGVPSLSMIKSFTSDMAGRVYILHVPGIAYTTLNSQEIADVVNFAVDKWGAKEIPFQPFSAEEVHRLRAVPVEDVVIYRRALTSRYLAEGKAVADYPWP